jgi:hypothetical protein
VSVWRSTSDGIDWSDSGPVELMKSDGSIVRDVLEVETFFNGEDEYPVPLLESTRSFFDFKSWRDLEED